MNVGELKAELDVVLVVERGDRSEAYGIESVDFAGGDVEINAGTELSAV